MESKNDLSAYLANISILLFGLFLIAFPLVFSTMTTDGFGMPKQVLLGVVVLAVLLFSGARMISEGAVYIARTPFDLAVALFAGVGLISSIIAVNRIDALTAYAPLLFAIIAFYLFVNLAKTEMVTKFLTYCLLIGALLAGFVAFSSFFKVYVLPFSFAKTQSFTFFGSLLEQAMYLAFTLPIAVGLIMQNMKGGKMSSPTGVFLPGIGALIITGALVISILQLTTTQKPVFLPYEVGFQTAFASLSQDSGRVVQGFFLGSGYGTYATDFARFKQPSFNLNQSLWALTFFRSSSFMLEILATLGIAGFLSFGYILFLLVMEIKARVGSKKTVAKNPVAVSMILLIIGALLLPFSPVTVATFFLLLGLFAAWERFFPENDDRYFDVELHFVASKKGGMLPIAVTPVDEMNGKHQKASQNITKLLPISFFIVFLVFSGGVGFYLYKFVASDILFQQALVAASANNGLQTYTDESNAIALFPYRDGYYRIASQTNIALANSLAGTVRQGSSPSAQIQQNILTLIQQSIQYARLATEIAPATSVNWQNLSSVYRSLIGFGQNAEQFAVVTQQQAIALDPNNPQNYINLGGIYYQLQQWDAAQNQFQVAVNLKPDYANAYYNLGHALEQKGDLQNALIAYQSVKTLVATDKQSEQKMQAEIDALQAKIGKAANEAKANASGTAVNQPGLDVNKPETKLPDRNPQVKIPAPTTSVTPAASGTTSPTPSPTQ